jgi:UPF0042 nucleotide-binding protein
LIVVTGLSGSGKTAALKALEDIGFFCVDNLPATVLPKFVQLSVLSGEVVNKVGIGMDSREKTFLTRYREVFEEVERLGIHIEVLFLDADENVLLRRFSETRRTHPLAQGRSVPEGIREERELLKDLKNRAEIVIDTSSMSVHDLKKTVWSYFERTVEAGSLQVNLMSFGFRHGIPHEADMVMDVRFLPNPYFVPELKSRPGTDPEVRKYVFDSSISTDFVTRLAELLKYLLPHYEKEGKRYLTVAIGCTGGRHRSVAVVEELSKILSVGCRPVGIVHRDVEK